MPHIWTGTTALPTRSTLRVAEQQYPNPPTHSSISDSNDRPEEFQKFSYTTWVSGKATLASSNSTSPCCPRSMPQTSLRSPVGFLSLKTISLYYTSNLDRTFPTTVTTMPMESVEPFPKAFPSFTTNLPKKLFRAWIKYLQNEKNQRVFWVLLFRKLKLQKRDPNPCCESDDK